MSRASRNGSRIRISILLGVAALLCGACSSENDGGGDGAPGGFAGGGAPVAGGAGTPTAGAAGAVVPVAGTAGAAPVAGVPGAAGAAPIAGASGAMAGAMAGAGGEAGAMAGAGGEAGAMAGAGGEAGAMAGAGGEAGAMAGAGGEAGAMAGAGGGAGAMVPASCCSDGDCICRDEPPSSLTSEAGPYATDSYSLPGTGCIYYPTDAEPPFSAVSISDGFGGSGGCGLFAQTSGWGPLYASYGIVAMIVETTAGDQPRTRGQKLLRGIEGFKAENENSSSPLYQKLAGRYGTSGFSMGGGGTTFAASDDSTLRSSVGLMAWTPTGTGVTVPTLFTCGSSDGLATCLTHGGPAYNAMPESTPKMIVTVSSSHVGQPSAGSGMQGAWGLAFQKVFLDGDERWRDVLLSGNYDQTTIQ